MAANSRSSKVPSYVFAALTAAWLCFIFSNSFKSAADSSEDSGRLLLFFQKMFPGMTEHVLRKLAHFAEFAILGIFASLAVLFWLGRTYLAPLLRRTASGNAPISLRRRIIPAVALASILCILAPVVDELLQLLSPGRSTEFLDMLIDFGGYVFGFALTAAIFLLILRRRLSKYSDKAV